MKKSNRKIMTILVDTNTRDEYANTCDRLGYTMSRRLEEFMKQDLKKISKIKEVI